MEYDCLHTLMDTESAISPDFDENVSTTFGGFFPNLRAEEKLHCDCYAKNMKMHLSPNLSPNVGIQGDGGLCRWMHTQKLRGSKLPPDEGEQVSGRESPFLHGSANFALQQL